MLGCPLDCVPEVSQLALFPHQDKCTLYGCSSSFVTATKRTTPTGKAALEGGCHRSKKGRKGAGPILRAGTEGGVSWRTPPLPLLDSREAGLSTRGRESQIVLLDIYSHPRGLGGHMVMAHG